MVSPLSLTNGISSEFLNNANHVLCDLRDVLQQNQYYGSLLKQRVLVFCSRIFLFCLVFDCLLPVNRILIYNQRFIWYSSIFIHSCKYRFKELTQLLFPSRTQKWVEQLCNSTCIIELPPPSRFRHSSVYLLMYMVVFLVTVVFHLLDIICILLKQSTLQRRMWNVV